MENQNNKYKKPPFTKLGIPTLNKYSPAEDIY